MSRIQLTDELKKEIGQHFVLGYHGPQLSDDILRLTAAPYYLGNVILMKRNVAGSGEGYVGGRPQEISELLASLQEHAKSSGQDIGLGIGTDQEGGLVSAFSTSNVVTQFPGAMALASISDTATSSSLEITERVYAAQAKELSLLGVNWTYAPVGDVNSDRRNPVIGVRSFGDDPSKVAQYVSAACKGLVSHGVSPSIKHFPGHGDTHIDSHLGLPRIRKDLKELEQTELVPWQHSVHNPSLGRGLDLVTVMTGHMSLPLITGREDEPASLSRAVTHGLLREKLGFGGVIVTDCLEMDAIAKTKGVGSNPRSPDDLTEEDWHGGPGIEEGAVLALEAGADIVMICHTYEKQVAAIERVWNAVESGRLSLGELRKSGERIRKWKQALGLEWSSGKIRTSWDQTAWVKTKEESAKISAAAYAEVVVMVKPGPSLAPSHAVAVYTPAMESYNKAVDDADGVLRTQGGVIRNTAGASFLSFVDTVNRYAPASHIVYGKHDAIAPQDTPAIFVLRNADRSTWQIDALRAVLKVSSRVVVVSSSTPYDLINFSPFPGPGSAFAHLACGEYTAQALEAVARVVFGERKATGQLAVAV
ncbi:glycoside hydrolase [Cristinia sonorae]|uniref:Glycoside hydrolase n=1 Tax=Cristinia sonorae TaxID=1940300 RepID=A0A8K0US00_9AGAR|nr:glycoside hydrolase [Cristinia sonorae]